MILDYWKNKKNIIFWYFKKINFIDMEEEEKKENERTIKEKR